MIYIVIVLSLSVPYITGTCRSLAKIDFCLFLLTYPLLPLFMYKVKRKKEEEENSKEEYREWKKKKNHIKDSKALWQPAKPWLTARICSVFRLPIGFLADWQTGSGGVA